MEVVACLRGFQQTRLCKLPKLCKKKKNNPSTAKTVSEASEAQAKQKTHCLGFFYQKVKWNSDPLISSMEKIIEKKKKKKPQEEPFVSWLKQYLQRK